MSYWNESQELLDATKAKFEALMERYKDYRNPGMLDGEPWAEEEREITKAFSDGLKVLRQKYPDWQSEEKPPHIQALADKRRI